MDWSAFLCVIGAKGDSLPALANYLGCTTESLEDRLKRDKLTTEEIAKIIWRYDLDALTAYRTFFAGSKGVW